MSRLSSGDPALLVNEIVDVARARNAANDITGALIFSGQRFAQYLEGRESDLQPIVRSILEDARHEQITTLWQDEVRERVFENWTLAYSGPSFYVDRHIKGLVGAKPQDKVTERNAVQLLRLMKSLAEGGSRCMAGGSTAVS